MHRENTGKRGEMAREEKDNAGVMTSTRCLEGKWPDITDALRVASI
jgi:hypothetical protein